uniref:RNA-directed RNA polymerase n=1 Tax=Panagrellus redivivus TaxID=6233 RepID=A0A7E4W4C1_PANRE
MDAEFYQKYAFIDYHLTALLNEWQRIKPHFEAKLPNVSSAVKPFLLQSLNRLKNRIDKATSKLYDVMKYVAIYTRIYQTWTIRWKLVDTRKTGLTDRYDTALDAVAAIDVLLEKFNGGQTISFKNLPYEFKNRLVELLPPADVVAFKLAGYTALKYCNRRKGMFCDSSHIITGSQHLSRLKLFYGWRPNYTFSSVRCFLRSELYFVQTILCLSLNSTEKFDRAVEIVAGNYTYLWLQGPFTWKHAVKLMNRSKRMKYASLGRQDYCVFAIMDAEFYQKYAFIDYHLTALLNEWQRIKPHFEAKLSNGSPTVKPFILQSLHQLKNRIDKATSKLYDVMKYAAINTRIYQTMTIRWKSLDTRKTGLTDRYNTALDAVAAIDVLREKFEGGQTIPLRNLPYEFRNRLVELLPPADVVNFKLSGYTALKYCNQRKGMFCDRSHTITNSQHLSHVKQYYGWRPKNTFSSVRSFLRSELYYVRTILCLNLNSTEKFDRAVEIVAGDYTCLWLHGPFTWKHAVNLMNRNKRMKYATLGDQMLLDVEDFDDFFEAIVQWLRQQKHAIAIYIECPTLDLTFEARIKEYVQSRTSFYVFSPEYWVVICKQPKI